MYNANTISRGSQPNKFAPAPVAGSAGVAGFGVPPPAPARPPPAFGGGGGYNNHSHAHARPNADPELREQERVMIQQQQKDAQAMGMGGMGMGMGQPKKRATGIPRTFLNIPGPSNPNSFLNNGDEDEEEELAAPEGIQLLQPNNLGFQALISRGGGMSKNINHASGTATSGNSVKTLEYALKVTAMSIPEHLQCGICAQLVKNAMLIPWDGEGRTACEVCMRDGLTKNAFSCPLTGMEGVSPDDLISNVGLRKAADLFAVGVMEKMEEIIAVEENEKEEQAVKDMEVQNELRKNMLEKKKEFEGGGLDMGVLGGAKKSSKQKRKRSSTDDGFEDEFGGDVFDVDDEEIEEEEEEDMNNMAVPVANNGAVGTNMTLGVNDASKKEDLSDDKNEGNTSKITANVTTNANAPSQSNASMLSQSSNTNTNTNKNTYILKIIIQCCSKGINGILDTTKSSPIVKAMPTLTVMAVPSSSSAIPMPMPSVPPVSSPMPSEPTRSPISSDHVVDTSVSWRY
mmetsp:Transcript_17463/g.26416  ORF Transcript_17463/g.26416 Transcript_17463/m.26416 type:complete len:514 (-) Transcript_17463:2481-4022(-)